MNPKLPLRPTQLFKLFSLVGVILLSPALTRVVLADFSSVNKSFSPKTILPGDPSKLTIAIYNSANRPLTGVNLTDDMNAAGGNIKVASPANIVNTCGGTIAAPIGGSTISLTGGGVNAAAGGTPQSCSITVDVTSTTAGIQNNTIPAKALINNENDTNGQSASDNLQVTALKTLTVSDTFTPSTILTGLNSTYTVKINNSNIGLPLNNTGLNFLLPTNLTLAGSPTSTCGGIFSGTSFSGGTLPGATNAATAGTCTLNFPVSSTVAGIYSEVIKPNSITTDRGVTNAATSGNATLDVQQSGGPNSVTLSKSFTSLAEGGTATLDIIITNANIFDLTNVSVSDSLPSGMTVASPSGITTTCNGTPAPILSAAVNSSVVAMTQGTVPKGLVGLGTCKISVKVTTDQPSGTALVNSIPIGNLSSDQSLTNKTSPSATTTVAPALVLSKSLAPASIPLNGSSILTLTIKNNAATSATGVSVTDTFPTNLKLFNPIGTIYSNCGTGTLVTPSPGDVSIKLTGATIAPNATCTIKVAVTSAVNGVYTNTIPANSLTSTQGWTEKNAHSATVTVRSGLNVKKRFSPNTVTSGTPTLLIVTLENETPDPITGTTVTDTLANNIVAATNPQPSTICANGSVTLIDTAFKITNATVPPQIGAVVGTCTFQAYVVSGTSGQRNNTITAKIATSNEGYTNIEAATASFTVQLMNLGITKGFTPTDQIDGGDPVTLLLTLSNGNNVALDNATFTDVMPSGMQVSSTPNPATTCAGGTFNPTPPTPGSGTFSFSGGTIPANGNCTVTLQVTSIKSGNLTNTIPANAVTTLQGASNPQAASKSLTVLPVIAISKSFSQTTIAQGTTAVLTLTLLNTNAFILTNAVFTDTLPSGMVVDNTPAVTNTCGGNIDATANSGFIKLTNGGIPATATCQITVTVKAKTAGTLTNTIPIGALTTGTGLQNKKAAIATIEVTPVVANDPNLILLKRITKINGGTTAKASNGTTIDLTTVVPQPDNPGTPRNESGDATDPLDLAGNPTGIKWPTVGYPQGSIDAGVIKTGDTIEYTIYFLSIGGKPVTNANLCDWVPTNTVFQPNNYGIGQGIQLAIGSTITPLTNVPDSDRGVFFNPGTILPATYPSGLTPDGSTSLRTSLLTCRTPAGSEGAVVVNLVNSALLSPNDQLPNATAVGTPGNSYGFIRFVSKVK
jgi:uncharacterized repeat protein (TIGR01451 family)